MLDSYDDSGGEMTGQNMPCLVPNTQYDEQRQREQTDRIITLRAGESVTSLETPEGYLTKRHQIQSAISAVYNT